VFGGLDGVITTFSTIASAFGGKQSIQVVIILTLANLIADALSMGVGDFFSSHAEFSHAVAEKKREQWEYDNLPAGERAEMVAKLVDEKAFDAADAERIIGVIGAPAHRDFFIDYMMHEELGLESPDDPWAAAKDGATTFISFIVFGAVPLIVYVICWAAGLASQGSIFGIACAFTFVTLFALGMLQGAITRLNLWRSGAYMAIIGSLATAAAFLVGWGLAQAITNSC
jgi:DNA damage-binding protein 1